MLHHQALRTQQQQPQQLGAVLPVTQYLKVQWKQPTKHFKQVP
jgi:hypothetical protein